jgi:FixJ family two-component response regulator
MLTAREVNVLGLLAQGCSYAAIGERLGISAHTVGSHIKERLPQARRAYRGRRGDARGSAQLTF